MRSRPDQRVVAHSPSDRLAYFAEGNRDLDSANCANIAKALPSPWLIRTMEPGGVLSSKKKRLHPSYYLPIIERERDSEALEESFPHHLDRAAMTALPLSILRRDLSVPGHSHYSQNCGPAPSSPRGRFREPFGSASHYSQNSQNPGLRPRFANCANTASPIVSIPVSPCIRDPSLSNLGLRTRDRPGVSRSESLIRCLEPNSLEVKCQPCLTTLKPNPRRAATLSSRPVPPSSSGPRWPPAASRSRGRACNAP